MIDPAAWSNIGIVYVASRAGRMGGRFHKADGIAFGPVDGPATVPFRRASPTDFMALARPRERLQPTALVLRDRDFPGRPDRGRVEFAGPRSTVAELRKPPCPLSCGSFGRIPMPFGDPAKTQGFMICPAAPIAGFHGAEQGEIGKDD